MLKMSSKFNISMLHALGIFLGLIFQPSLLLAQQIQIPVSAQDIQSDQQKNQEIENQRNIAKDDAQRKLVPEAIFVVKAMKRAIELVKTHQTSQAISTLEQVNQKTNFLFNNHPKNALLPVDYSIDVVNNAPIEIGAIRRISHAAEMAVNNMNYPDARLLLNALRSEINVSFYCLPLALYPPAINNAIALLKDNKSEEAIRVLQLAGNSLIMIDEVIPIPIVHTIVLLKMAEDKIDNEKDSAIKLISLAKSELERAKDLGYVGKDKEYEYLNDMIRVLQEKVKSNQSSRSIFGNIKDRLKNFIKRFSAERKSPNEEPAPNK